MKIGTKLLTAFGIGLATVAAVVIALWLSADVVLKTGIEKLGPEVLKAPVTVKGVRLELESGKVLIQGLVVGNPAAFGPANAIRLGKIDIAIDTGTVARDVIVIKRLAIEAPEVTYETRDATSNLDALKRNVDEYLHASSESGNRSPHTKRERRFIVDEFTIRNGKVNLSGGLPSGSSVSVALPAIQLRHVGRNSGGVTPVELTKLVTSEITSKSARVAVATLNRIRRSAGDTLGSMREIFR